MKQYNEPKKVQLFSRNIKYGQSQKLNSMYVCHGYQIKILWEGLAIKYCCDSLCLFHNFKDHV